MELIKPDFGLLFYMLIGFGILFFILAKFAWPVILKSIHEREEMIENQLHLAQQAKLEMEQLHSHHEELLLQAKEERDAILTEARKIRDKMYEDVKVKAEEERQHILEDAQKTIHFEKMKALTDIQNFIANASIEIAEKILREELSDKQKQQQLVEKLAHEVKYN